MGLFDGFLSSDSKFSDLKRFVGDFEIIEVKDKNGRMRKKALYTGVWTVLRDAGTATRAKMYAAAATAFVLIAAYIWSLLLTHVGSGSLLVMLPLLAGLFPVLYLLMGVFSLPFRGKPMRRDQYMHSFIRASRSAVGVSAFAFAGLLASFVYRIILGDWLFLPEDWYFIAACAVIGMLSAGTVYFLRSIDLSERENAAFESKPL
ncbi:MAG: hypothetical protein IKH30_15910 [Clostridia bacterium]|nr:hypothetical protein [Clostridia bacterium]